MTSLPFGATFGKALLRVLTYVVLAFGLTALIALRSGRPSMLHAALIVGAGALAAVLSLVQEWLLEQRQDSRERIAIGALFGALSLGAFAAALSLATTGFDVAFVGIAGLVGAAMQAARAFSSRPALDSGDDAPPHALPPTNDKAP